MKITYPEWQIPILCVFSPILIVVVPVIFFNIGALTTKKSAYDRGYRESVIMCKRDAERCQVIYNYLTLKQEPKHLE
jgi:hypothetical protein